MSLNPVIGQWAGRRVWLVGASSGIGRALAVKLHGLGAEVWVSARNAAALQTFTEAHPGSHALPLDVTDAAAVQTAFTTLTAAGPLDVMCYCAGHYNAMRAQQFDLADAHRHHQINYAGALNVMGPVLAAMLARGEGHLSFISSVAGFAGLPKSLAYGPTKAALINLAETLYLDVHRQGLGVSVINPGFVDTPLTANNDFDMPALMTPEAAAQEIVDGWAAGRFEIHFPRRFTRAIKLLRLLPYRWFFPAVHKITGL